LQAEQEEVFCALAVQLDSQGGTQLFHEDVLPIRKSKIYPCTLFLYRFHNRFLPIFAPK
jgi:hypothetical protein